ncbi:MAG: insulinase family protein [Saprospiraceae bacterium]|nr:insulinase family protein [Saprospiraceae bacterium]
MMRPLLFLFLLFISSTYLTAQDSWPKKVTSVEGITEYQLENGLKVLLFPDPSKQTITVNITYLVGSRHEGYGETGMAHLLEHMVFKGTPDHPDIPSELSDHGSRPNGTTWFDRTNYFETFAATEENLKWALDLEADRMVNSFIAKKDLDSEMTVVRNEYEAGENFPQSVLQKRILASAYSWHNYGNTTIGARSDIENVPIERLQAFYKKYYQPDNAVLLVAGKIDEDATLALVQEYFGSIPRPERELIPTYTSEPTQDGERNVTLRRNGDVQVVACLYHICSGLHPEDAAIDVLIRTLTTEPSGRIYKQLIESKKASSQYGYSMSLSEPGFAYFGASVTKDQSLEDAKNTLLAILDSVGMNPPTQEEVNRAKAEILKQIELALTNTERIGLTLSEYIAMGDWRMLFIGRDRIEAVTPEDVARVAAFYFKPSNRTVGVFTPEEKPERVEIPSAPSVATLVDGYKGKEAMAQGEAFDPSPENIQSRTMSGTLKNGAKYAFIPKETKGDVVYAHLGFRFGDENTLSGKQTVAQIVPAMLDRGTKTKTRQEIKDLFDQYKAQVSVYGGGGRNFIQIQTTKDNLEKTMNLCFEMLKEPSFPEVEFQSLVQERVAQIEQFKSEPQSKASTLMNRHLNPHPADHIEYVPTPEEQVERLKDLTLDEVKEFYEEYFGTGGDATLTVVGEFDPQSIKELYESNMEDWKEGMAYKKPTATVFEGKTLNEEIQTPDKANAMFLVSMEIPMRDDDPDYAALYVGNYLLGGGFLNSRLATRIRQQEGLSYGVGSFFNADGTDKEANFGSYAIYNPEVKDQLEAAFMEEIEKVRTEGFTQEELEAAKSGILQSNQVTRAQDQSLLTILNNNMMFERDMDYYSQLDKQIQSLTLEEVNSAFKKYIDPSHFNMVKAGDFKVKMLKP